MTAKPRHARQPSTLKHLVWALRCLGLYCFKTPTSAAEADAVEISLPLLLWAVFVKTCQVVLTVHDIFLYVGDDVSDVGQLTTTVNRIMVTSSSLLGQMSFLINGGSLCRILSECEEDPRLRTRKKESCLATIFSLEGIMTLLFYYTYAVIICLSFTPLGFRVNLAAATTAVLSVIYATIVASMMLPAALFRETLAVASRRLSFDSLLEVSFLQGVAAGPEQRLDTLERRIREVSVATYYPSCNGPRRR